MRATIGISIGGRVMGIAVISDSELVAAHSLTLRNRQTEVHTNALNNYIRQYGAKVIAMRMPPATHHSERITELLGQCVELCKRRGCTIEYKNARMQRLELPQVSNKREAIQYVSQFYPQLVPIMERDCKNRQRYHTKMFEAVIAAHISHAHSRA